MYPQYDKFPTIQSQWITNRLPKPQHQQNRQHQKRMKPTNKKHKKSTNWLLLAIGYILPPLPNKKRANRKSILTSN